MTVRPRPAPVAALAVAALAAVAVVTLPARVAPGQDDPGSARTSPMTRHLCSSRRVPCSIRVGDGLREGAATHVRVTGRPSSTVQVRLFALDVVGQRILGTEPIGDSVAVRLNAAGHGSETLPIAPFGVDDHGGWALVTVADTRWQGDPGQVVGQIVPIGARSPTLLGDGYGSRKPVGAVLDMEIANHVAGTEFAVEYRGDDGSWHNVTVETAERQEARQPVLVLRYAVPNGLVAVPHRFRAHNVTDPSAVDREWIVVPSTDALPQERAPLFDPPELGADLTTSLTVVAASSGRVVVGAAVLGSLAVVVAVAWPALAIRRRRVVLPPP